MFKRARAVEFSDTPLDWSESYAPADFSDREKVCPLFVICRPQRLEKNYVPLPEIEPWSSGPGIPKFISCTKVMGYAIFISLSPRMTNASVY